MKMMNNGCHSFLAALALLLLSAGCSDFVGREASAERGESLYRSAMSDYQAGRLDAALAGFVKAVKHTPGNASARFQLACLLHDYKKDYLGAFCEYREYLQQRPDSDRSSVASTRLATCEKELATALAAKYKLDGAESQKVIAVLRKELDEKTSRLDAAEKDLQTVRARSVALSEERDRLVTAMKGMGEGENAAAPVVASMSAKEAKALLDEDEDQSPDKAEAMQDIAALKADEKEEQQSSSSLLPVQSADAKAKRDKLLADRERAKREAEERELKRHPPEYIVQEGDTLYRLAERFYGRINAWKAIRDANKAVISNDGRLKAGTRITLPYGVK